MTPAELQALGQTIIRLRDGCDHDVEFGEGKMFRARCPKCDRIVERDPDPRLSDVLLALHGTGTWITMMTADMHDGAVVLSLCTDSNEKAQWFLCSDSLLLQNDDTKQFLASLLLSR